VRRSAFAGSAATDLPVGSSGRQLSGRQLAAIGVACAVVSAAVLAGGGLLPLPSLLKRGWQLIAPGGSGRNPSASIVDVRTPTGGGPLVSLFGGVGTGKGSSHVGRSRVSSGDRPDGTTGSTIRSAGAGSAASGSAGSGSADSRAAGSRPRGSTPSLTLGVSGGSAGLGASTGDAAPIGAGVTASASADGASAGASIGGTSVGVTVPLTGPSISLSPTVSVDAEPLQVNLPTIP
jgi:hypothetical protein